MVDVPGPSKLKSKKQSAKEQPPPPETDTEERQEGVSDLEWMQQRMSKKIDDKAFEQSDEEAEEEPEKEVGIADFLLICTFTIRTGSTSGSDRSGSRSSPTNRASLRPKPRIFLYRFGSSGALQTLWRNITGETPFLLVPSSCTPRDGDDKTNRDIRLCKENVDPSGKSDSRKISESSSSSRVIHELC